jgi:hypothetical protein
MTLPLPGQRGLPSVAQDVPSDDLEAAFIIPDPVQEYAIIMVIVEHVQLEEIQPKLIEFAQGLNGGATITVVNAVANGRRETVFDY